MTFEVCFSHGQESGPWGTKIQRMATLCRDAGHAVHSVDYRGVPDPDRRIEILMEWCAARSPDAPPLVLVGSSMGGYVAAGAAPDVSPVGLFLLAPAFYMPGYTAVNPPAIDCPVAIVHGLSDEVIPVAHSLRFAQAADATLHAVPGDHRLIDALPTVLALFDAFLRGLAGNG